ncbi:MAG: aminoacetone oxidase family FAD-binding enzyme [Planctomycetota bacterium]
MSDIVDVAVIGAGAAGLLAGLAAARGIAALRRGAPNSAAARVLVYERMATPGRKVAISGGGRCNFTNTFNPRDFVRRFGDKHAAYLGHALRAFSNHDLIALLALHGVDSQLERDNYLYTKSGRGSDVVNALQAELQKAGGRLQTNVRIQEITRQTEPPLYLLKGVFNHITEEHRAHTVIICTGGLSYPATGSTGDGYAWARAFGHTVTSLRAALVGLTVEEDWPRELQGLACSNAEVALFPPLPLENNMTKASKTKPLCVERADILFTHFGISGPAILNLSNAFVASNLNRARLVIDFLPTLSHEELDRQLLARFKQHPHRGIARALAGLLPERLLEYFEFEKSSGAEAQMAVCRLPKITRDKWLTQLKATTLTVTGTRDIEHGEVTAGGVAWNQINPATLESKLCPSLFFAGEILDIAGRCGGFNLQAAFSTGYLAGQSAAAVF